ncbi:hypothetical protein ACFYWX_26150 [Streptomyces sp. NPDC002888]|uniref:hypothetical protein n=1 Tax=Streptomyces sp. NPDC002888 TaxID=3364668 RepID=UPI0036B8A054
MTDRADQTIGALRSGHDYLTVDLGFLPVAVDVATVAGVRLTEFAHHTWDVEVAFDHEAPLLPA